MAGTSDRPRLIGRDPVLATLRSGAASAAGGRGRLVLVTGEPGIGKTALLGELTGEGTDTGALVLWAQCWDGDGAPAYWPWVQVLRAGIAAGGDAGDAAMLLPGPMSTPRTGQVDRFRLFDAVVTFLAGLAEKQPVLAVLDDLHWADEGSLRLLEFAARHLTGHAVLLLGAYRDEEAGERLLRLASASERVVLPGLPRPAVATLMTALTETAPAPAVAVEVWRRTGGNPFLVRELTRLLVAQGGCRQLVTSPPELLDNVRDVLERRLARLSQPCAELLTIASVLGPEARIDVLHRTAAHADDVARLLEEAVTARVLARPASPGRPHRFSHDLFRETILAGLPAERRTELHLAIGRALEALRDEGAPVHPAELAAHFAAANAVAPAEAVRYGTAAAEDATARSAFEEARGHYERALVAVGLVTGPASAARLDLLLRLGDVRNRTGDSEAAHEALRGAAGLARRLGDGSGLARAALGIHELGWRHVHAEAIAILEEAALASSGCVPVLRARVLAALARDLHHSSDERRDWVRAPELAAQAVEEARQSHDPATLAFCLLALHDTGWRPGTARDRLPVIDEMLAAADEARDREMAAQARLLRAAALIELGDPGGPAELDTYCGQCEELGHARARHGALSRRATAALIAGDLDRAAELAGSAYDLGKAIGEADTRGVYETLLAGIERAGGDPSRSGVAPDARLDSEPWPGLPLIEAYEQLVAGDLAAAGRALERLDLADLPPTYDLELLTFAADTVAAAGTAEQRSRVEQLLCPYAGLHIVVGGCAAYYGAVDHYLGILARSLGRAADAHRHFTSAAAMHDRLGAPRWAEHSRRLGATCRSEQLEQACVFHRDGDVWTIAFRGTESHLPDIKGLRDLATLLARPGHSVHAVELHTGRPPQTGADEVLDDRAKAAYRRRLAELESDIDEAEADHDPHRAEKARTERGALLTELSAAIGLGRRGRRLGDERERARKAVTARIRDAIDRIGRVDPALGEHLRGAVQTGTWCTYSAADPIRWRTTASTPQQADGGSGHRGAPPPRSDRRGTPPAASSTSTRMRSPSPRTSPS